jgi:hypothetical protein
LFRGQEGKEVVTESDVGEGLAETLPGMVLEETRDVVEDETDLLPMVPDDEAEEPAAASEEVLPENEVTPLMDSNDDKDVSYRTKLAQQFHIFIRFQTSMPDETAEGTLVKELVGGVGEMVDEVHSGAKNAMQSIGDKITDFIGGNMRKVKSLLHINEKMPDEDTLKGILYKYSTHRMKICCAPLLKFSE